jgi:hypothetical protein
LSKIASLVRGVIELFQQRLAECSDFYGFDGADVILEYLPFTAAFSCCRPSTRRFAGACDEPRQVPSVAAAA